MPWWLWICWSVLTLFCLWGVWQIVKCSHMASERRKSERLEKYLRSKL